MQNNPYDPYDIKARLGLNKPDPLTQKPADQPVDELEPDIVKTETQKIPEAIKPVEKPEITKEPIYTETLNKWGVKFGTYSNKTKAKQDLIQKMETDPSPEAVELRIKTKGDVNKLEKMADKMINQGKRGKDITKNIIY